MARARFIMQMGRDAARARHPRVAFACVALTLIVVAVPLVAVVRFVVIVSLVVIASFVVVV